MTNQQRSEALRPITRYEVVDCIDSKHVPAVIPNGAGSWVSYEDHLAALVEAQQPAPSAAVFGLRLVPVEPTDQMVQAAHHIDLSYMPGQEGADRAAIYRAMVVAAPQPAVQQGDASPTMPRDIEMMATNRYRLVPSGVLAYKVVDGDGNRSLFSGTKDECQIVARKLTEAFLDGAYVALSTHPAAPVAQGDALTDTYVQQVPDKCDRIVWRGRYYHLPIDAAEHSYTEPSPMAKVAAALRQKAEQEDAAYQARRSDQGLMESEWGPMEDAPPHEDPPMHVAIVEGDDTVRTLQWNRDVAAFAYPAGTLLYAARSQAKEGA